jgi:hypothetical protein
MGFFFTGFLLYGWGFLEMVWSDFLECFQKRMLVRAWGLTVFKRVELTH